MNSIPEKILQAYLQAAKTAGQVNKSGAIANAYYNEKTGQAIFKEEDGDTFISSGSGDNLEVNLYKGLDININDDSIYTMQTINLDDLAELEAKIDETIEEVAQTYEHKEGTGSVQKRLTALEDATANNIISRNGIRNGNTVDRDKIQKWLDSNGLSNSDAVEGGFNVDDVLEYYSTQSGDPIEKIFYHLMANEAWLDNGANGNNKIDGRLTNLEVENFYKDRFGVDISEETAWEVNTAQTKEWKKSNKEVGNDLHPNYTEAGLRSLIYDYHHNKDFMTTKNYNNYHYSYNEDDYSNSYSSRTVSYDSSDITSKRHLNSILTTLYNNDRTATMTLDSKVKNLYDEESGEDITLSSGKTYKVSVDNDEYGSDYVRIQYGSKTYVVDRDDFTSKCYNKIEELEYTNKSTSSSRSSSSYSKSHTSTKSGNYTTDTYNSSYFNNATKLKNVLNDLNLSNSSSYAKITMDSKVSLTATNGDKINLKAGSTYDIVNVSSTYVTINYNGEDVKIKRGTSGSAFEARIYDAIDQIKTKQRTTSSSSSSNRKAFNLSMTNYSPDSVENYINNLQNSSRYDATLTLIKSNLYDASGNYLQKGEYEITTITDDYVKIKDEDGDTHKIYRGTDEDEFEWYLSKSNKSAVARIEASYK